MPSKTKSHSDTLANVPTKITPPVLSSVYARTRLFLELDHALKKPVVWIDAPGGAGKTTLVASYLQARKLPALWYQVDQGDVDLASFFYHLRLAVTTHAPRSSLPLLTPEYLGGLTTFTANYFRQLFGCLKRGSVLVIDNCQDGTANGKLLEILAEGFEQIPSGINVIVISREPTPPELARATVRGRLATIGWEALQLTEEETLAIADLRNRQTPLTPAALRRLHVATEGWVAGLVLLTEHTQRSVIECGPKENISSQVVFDFFANEILKHASVEVQTLLLKTAFLGEFSQATACRLTGNAKAGALLDDLTRRNLFTVRHANGNFEYHPLYRAFLVNRLSALHGSDDIRELKSSSAQVLLESGDSEAAITLLLQAEDWVSVLRLILEQARDLRTQGRTQTLETWLMSIPESVWADNPWVLYWLGVCRLPFSPSQARAYFERAFLLFEREDDASPLYLTWSRIIESYTFDMDDFKPMVGWIDRYTSLQGDRKPPAKSIENASVFAYVSILLAARGNHPDLIPYAERAERLFWEQSDRNYRLPEAATLMFYYLWAGDAEKIVSLFDRVGVRVEASDIHPLIRLNWYAWISMHAAMIGADEEVLRAISDGLALADSSGIHLWDTQIIGYGILSYLSVGNAKEARSLLQRMAGIPHQGRMRDAFYGSHAAVVSLHEGNVKRAIEEAERATSIANATGMFFGRIAYGLELACIYSRQRSLDRAEEALKQVRPNVTALRSKLFGFACDLCEANIRYSRGDYAGTRVALTAALSAAQKDGFITPAYFDREDMASLYRFALESGIYPEYVRTIIRKTRLSPPRGALTESWPWTVKIRTFGRLTVIRNDQTLSFHGKAQKKPLELLRSLIAFGSRDVSAAKIAQLLWPETEGDAARITLRSNVMRLRRLIGDDAIIFNEGELTLDPTRCWVDVWALEQLCDGAPANLSLVERGESLLRLYTGAFLADDDEATWVFVQRERVRSKFLRALTEVCQALEASGDFAAAIPMYQKGVEADPVAEELYRGLMRCYRQLKSPAQVLAVYERCRKMLTSVLRVEPSAETRAIYLEIRKQIG